MYRDKNEGIAEATGKSHAMLSKSSDEMVSQNNDRLREAYEASRTAIVFSRDGATTSGRSVGDT